MMKKNILITSAIVIMLICLIGCGKENTNTLTTEEKELAKETMDEITNIFAEHNISLDNGHYLVNPNFDFEKEDVTKKNVHVMKENVTFSTNDFIVPSLIGVDENLNEYRYFIIEEKNDIDLYNDFSIIGFNAIEKDNTIKIKNVKEPEAYSLDKYVINKYQYSFGNDVLSTTAYMLSFELESTEENKTYFCAIYLTNNEEDLTTEELMSILLDGVTISYSDK